MSRGRSEGLQKLFKPSPNRMHHHGPLQADLNFRRLPGGVASLGCLFWVGDKC